MFFTLHYEVARSIQETKLRKAKEAREAREALRSAGHDLGSNQLASDQLNGVAVGIGVGGYSPTPGLGRRGSQTWRARRLQPVVDLVEIVDGKVDHDPKWVA